MHLNVRCTCRCKRMSEPATQDCIKIRKPQTAWHDDSDSRFGIVISAGRQEAPFFGRLLLPMRTVASDWLAARDIVTMDAFGTSST